MLAIEGGKPVRTSLLQYGHQWIDDEDIAAVVEVLKGDWLTQGPKVAEFEEKVAAYCGAKYAVAVSSGTTALYAACTVAGLKPGDEAITTPITFVATANAIALSGAKPVFADIRADTLNIDVSDIKKKITTRTKAILPVDFAGYPVDIDEIMAVAKAHNLLVIEDAAHALGARFQDGRKVGSVSDMTILSFHPVKHITSGEGGMILTNNEAYYNKIRTLRHHNILRDNKDERYWYYRIMQPGQNYRLTDMQCALGTSQLKKLDRFIARRREIAGIYDRALSGIDEIITPVPDSSRHVYHIYVIRIKPEKLKVDRNRIIAALKAENIGVAVHYIPVHLLDFYREEFGYKPGQYPRAEKYYETTMTLPIFPRMTDADVKDVIDAVQKVLDHYRK